MVRVNNFRLMQSLRSLTSTLLTRPSWKEHSATLLVQMCRYLHQLQGKGLLTHEEHLQKKKAQDRVKSRSNEDTRPFMLSSVFVLTGIKRETKAGWGVGHVADQN